MNCFSDESRYESGSGPVPWLTQRAQVRLPRQEWPPLDRGGLHRATKAGMLKMMHGSTAAQTGPDA
jgi:hypothetical protein